MISHHLNVVCDDIWERLRNSIEFGINQGEETLTDNLLLYLASQKLSGITVIQTPKNKEKLIGTDWEWWIGNKKNGYLRYAVQAKKLDLKSGRYASLNHKVGKGKGAIAQHKVLEMYAKSNNAIPLYAFYNYLAPSNYPKSWNCNLKFDISKLGCTVTPLKNVKIALSKRGYRTFKKIHAFPETVPLRCLAVCPNITCSVKASNIICESDRIYINPLNWFNEGEQPLIYPEQLPSQYYDHDLGFYPKRILVVETWN